MKRIIGIVLCAVMLTAALAGCGTDVGKNENGIDISSLGDTGGITLPITDKNITLKCLIETTVSGVEDKFLFQTIKDITGITIEPIVTTAANAKQKLQMLAASKQLPDIGVYYFDDTDRSSLAKNGALLCVNDKLDIMPNIKKLIETDEVYKKAFEHYSEGDGKTYMVPSYGIERDINHCMMFRKDVFDEAGIEMWHNGEEFRSALKKLKEKNPDCIPFSVKQQFDIINYLCPQWGLVTDCTPDSSGKYVSNMIHDEMKDMLRFLRELYSEGLLDTEFLTTTQASWSAKMTNDNTAYTTFDWVDRMDIFYESVKDKMPEYNLTIGYPIGSTGKFVRMNGAGTNAMYIANNENAEISAKLVDFLMSEAGARLTTLGLEGVTYDHVDGKVVYRGFEDASPSTVDLQNEYGMFLAGMSPRFDKECAYFMYTPQVENAQKFAVENELLQDFEFSANISDADDSGRYNSILSDLRKEFEIFASNYILCKNDADSSWDEWVSKAKEIGVEELQNIYSKYAD